MKLIFILPEKERQEKERLERERIEREKQERLELEKQVWISFNLMNIFQNSS